MTVAYKDNKVGIVREFTMMYDKGDEMVRRLVDAWYVARDFGEVDMIECQMEQYKKEIGMIGQRKNEG